MKEWRAFMKKYYPDGNLTDSLQRPRLLGRADHVQVLKQCGDDLTRENVMRQAASLKSYRRRTLLPGVTVDTGPTTIAPIEPVQLQRFNGKQWERFGEVMGGR